MQFQISISWSVHTNIDLKFDILQLKPKNRDSTKHENTISYRWISAFAKLQMIILRSVQAGCH